MMDFEAHVIKVEDARKPVTALPDDIVDHRPPQRGQLILTEVRAGSLPLDAVIDTGSEITIGNLALRDKLLRRHGTTASGRSRRPGSPASPFTLQLARIGELQLGPVTLQRCADRLCRRAAVQAVRARRSSRRCCSAPTSSKPSAGCRSTSARARSASSCAAAAPTESASALRRIRWPSRACPRPTAPTSAGDRFGNAAGG